MRSAAPPNDHPANAPNANIAIPAKVPGAVPAQQPARSPQATTTASQPPPGPAGVSNNANAASSSTVNPNPTTNGTADHGRKPSMVIDQGGASGYTSNGGPVGTNVRLPQFGSMGQGSPMPQSSVPQHSHNSSLGAPNSNPRATSPAHSPSPIPQPPASGGRPPSGMQSQNGGMTFGSMGADADQARSNHMHTPLGPGLPMHERRTSSQSMQGEMGNQGMNRGFMAPNGRGRGYPTPPYGSGPVPSPGMGYRQMSNSRPGPQGMQPGSYQHMPPGSPFGRGRNSPAVSHPQPHMPGQYVPGNQPMGYPGYPPMGPQAQQGQGQQHGYSPYNAQSGYYQPYFYPGQSQSPGPGYPSPYGHPQGPMQPPYHPQSMSRSTSQASERPPSTSGQPQSQTMQPAQPASQPPAASSASSVFVRPKKSSAIVIKDSQGNVIDLNKPSPSPGAAPIQPPQSPLIVNSSTPPPAKSVEERKNAFQEQVMAARRKEAEAKAKEENGAASPPDAKKDSAAEPEPVKEAAVEAEKAAAADAGDKKGEEVAAKAAVDDLPKPDVKKAEETEETEDERMERMIAEMEAQEKEEEEREKAYAEKKRLEKEANDAKEAEAAKNADAELKRQEREAEEREEQRERERAKEAAGETSKPEAEADTDAKSEFAKLGKPSLGPAASAPASGTETPASEESSSMPPPPVPSTRGAQKPKPAHLKLETNKRVEPAEPTPGMQSLKSARFLNIQSEEVTYPDGFKSPNPALNQGGQRKARAYDKSFLLQFQNVFKEKPSVDWDQKVKDTLGPSDAPQSARTPSSNMGRSASSRGPMPSSFSGPMGSFGGGAGARGTTSEQRFQASSGQIPARGGMGQMGQVGGPMRMPSNLGMGASGAGMIRQNSMGIGPNSPRQPSGRGGSRASHRPGDRALSKKQEAEMAAKMPLTAHMELKPLEKSQTGWKPTSLGQAPGASGVDPSGNMAPDMVQRKVKSNLNKMTPENFEKISDQILQIAAQSKNESDGRTLRQVIQLTFEKACDEAHWAGMYARFCFKMLTTMSTEIRDETIKDKAGNPVVGGALFRKYLLNRCQEEFERGWQVNLPDKPEGEGEAALLSDEYYIAAAAKRRGLGLIQFIGQLYKLKMLTLRIMHECVLKLLNFEGEPDESAIENLTTLLKAVGATMAEDETGNGFLNAYFDRIENTLLKNEKLASRPRFMVMDLVDLRKAGWKGKDDAKGPKTIQQIHAEAEAAQRAAEAEKARGPRGGPGGRPQAGRGDARNFSGGPMPPPVDYQRTTVGMDDLRRLQNRGSRPGGASLGPGGNLGPGGSMLGPRASSRRGAGLGPGSSGATTRTNTPPVDKDKKEEQSSTNAFGALAALDPSGEANEDAASRSEAASPPAARNRSKSPLPAESKADETTA